MIGQENTRRGFLLSGAAGLAASAFGAEPAGKAAANKEIRIVILADEKDHGPAGNGLHDYPLWQKRWTALLGGEKVTGTQVTTAWHWPSEEQFQTADVIAAYCYLNPTGERLVRLRRYLDDGGGLVLIHSATWIKPKPSREVAEVLGVGGFTLYRHGQVQLKLTEPEHPVCAGLPETIVLDDDETYWPPTPMMENVTVLATSVEDKGRKGSTPRAAQPMFWCLERGRGRVFGCVPGHRIETFDQPLFRKLLLRGMAWAAGEPPARFDSLVSKGGDKNALNLPVTKANHETQD